VGKDATRCDNCGRRIRRNHHGLVLTDPLTGQEVGRYHARPGCKEKAVKYLTSGTVLAATFLHPDRCGPNQERCDAGLSEDAAV
jgi:hypothetical protein